MRKEDRPRDGAGLHRGSQAARGRAKGQLEHDRDRFVFIDDEPNAHDPGIMRWRIGVDQRGAPSWPLPTWRTLSRWRAPRPLEDPTFAAGRRNRGMLAPLAPDGPIEPTGVDKEFDILESEGWSLVLQSANKISYVKIIAWCRRALDVPAGGSEYDCGQCKSAEKKLDET